MGRGLLRDDSEVGEGRKEMDHVEDLNHRDLPSTCLEIVLNRFRALLERDAINDG